MRRLVSWTEMAPDEEIRVSPSRPKERATRRRMVMVEKKLKVIEASRWSWRWGRDFYWRTVRRARMLRKH